MATNTAVNVLAEARKEVGYVEQPKGSNVTKFAPEAGHANRQPWCVTGRTMILTDSGLRPADSIRIGDMLATKEGRFRPVTAVASREADVLRIHAQGSKLEITAEHPIWAVKERCTHTVAKLVDGVGAAWVSAGDLTSDGWRIGHAVVRGERSMSTDLAYVFGIYVADGWASGSGAGLADSHDQGDRIEKALVEIGAPFRRYERRTGVQFGLSGWLAKAVRAFGHDSLTKGIGDALSWDRAAREAFMAGYTLGDGHIDTTGVALNAQHQMKCTTVSKPLAVGLAMLVRSLDLHPQMMRIEREATAVIEGRTVNQQQEVWLVSWTVRPPIKQQCIEIDNVLWTKLKRVEAIGRHTVYDFTVAEDHSFIADGVIVHNCASFISAILIRCHVLIKGNNVLVPSSRTMFENAKKNGWAVPVSALRAGDVIHNWRGISIRKWQGHVAFVVRVILDKKGRIVSVVTIEGNTDRSGSPTGGMVLEKTRSVAWWRIGAWRPPYAA